jgi:hypothetical protein
MLELEEAREPLAALEEGELAEEPEEEKLLLPKEEAKPFLPGDRSRLLEVSLLNGAAPPPGNLFGE